MYTNSIKSLGILIVLLLMQYSGFSQLTGIKTIPGDYASINAAITDLNTQGVGAGGVTFNIVAGYTETIGGTLSVTATGTAANPVLFQKSGSGVNPLVTAYTGGTGTPATAVQDGVWNLVGSDYITINGIDLTENGANSGNALMEYGYALYKAGTTNGCQHDTIKNCTVTLNRNNVTTGVGPMFDGSVGILVANSMPAAANTSLSVTTATGSNSFNSFYSNTVQNSNIGIGLSGFADVAPYTYADYNNDIGGNNAGTGNTVKNFGGGINPSVDTAVGIQCLAQYNLNISYNTINSNDGGGVTHNFTLKGIFNKAASGAAAIISYNTVTVSAAIPNVTINANTRLAAIENDGGSGGTNNTININNNTITNCSLNYAVNSSTNTNGLFGIVNTGAPDKLYINKNTFSGNTSNIVISNGQVSMIFNRGAPKDSFTVDGNNTISLNLSAASASASNTRIIWNFPASYSSSCVTGFTNNTFTGFTSSNTTCTGYLTFIFNVEEGSSMSMIGNTMSGISGPYTSGQVIGFYNNANSGTTDGLFVKIQKNTIVGLTKTGTGTGATYGIYEQPKTTLGSGSILIDNNNFSGLSAAGSGVLAGINITQTSTTQPIIVANNIFTNFGGSSTSIYYGMNASGGGTGSSIHDNSFTSIAGGGIVYGFYLGNSSAAVNQNVYNNTISALSSSGAASVVTGIYQSQGQGMNYYKNKIYDLTATGATGKVYGFNIAGAVSTGGTNISIYNNLISDLKAPNSNTFTAGTTDAVSGIYLSNSSALATIKVFYNNILLTASSVATPFYTSGIYHIANATSTTNRLLLKDNIIINNSTPAGAGVSAAIRRSAVTAANFDAGSDNNLLYAGTPGASNVLYADGTNLYQNIAQYRNAFPSQGLHSVTDNTSFLSTSGVSVNFLRPDPAVTTPIEGGGVAIAGITDDYTGTIRNTTTPDIGAYEGNYSAVDTIPPVITYTALTNTTSTTNRVLPSFAAITDPSGVNTTSGSKPRIYYKKKTDANAIAGNTSLDNGWKYTEAGNTSSAFNFTIDYSLLQAPVAPGDTIQYLVVAQDMAATPNAGPNNGVLFPVKPATVNLTGSQMPVGGTYDSYAITNALSGTIYVGVGQTYTSLTNNDAFGLFRAINQGTVTGNINAVVVSDLLLESGAVSLNKWNEEGVGNYNLSINPDGTTERLILGSNTSLISLTGAYKVSFNGNYSGSGSYLRFRNTNVGAASTFSFTNESRKDSIQNCYVEGAGNSSGGNIVLGTSGVPGGIGNDSLVVMNNIIRDRSDAAGVPSYLIRCGSTAGWENDNELVSGNQFINWTADAIAMGTGGNSGDNWTITKNYFFQTAARTTNLYGIHLYSAGGTGHQITSNSIGGSAADRSGTAMSSSTTASFGMGAIYSIATNTTAANPLVISGNTISNIANTSASTSPVFYGIYISGSYATISGNTVGGGMQPYDTLRGAGPTAGIYAGGTCTVTNNLVKDIANYISGAVYTSGIFIAGSAYLVNNNTIDSIRSNSTYNNVNAASSNIATGIAINSGSVSTNVVSNNKISNIISMNNLTTNTAPVVVAGILTTAGVTAPVSIFNNKISNVYGFNTTANFGNNIFGIADLGGSGANNTYYNNAVNISTNVTPQSWVRGIAYNSNLGQQCSFYNNTVVLNATLNNPNGAAAFYRLNALSVTLKNNLFYNLCTNAGTGPVTAMHNASTATGWGNSASDYNLMYTTDPTKLNYWGPSAASLSYTNWIAASSCDLNSVSDVVPFISSTDLHIDGSQSSAWNVYGRGIALPSLVTGDYDGDTRSTYVGVPTTIGFDEIAVPGSMPADMVVTPATPIVGTPTVFTSAGRKIAEINWTGGTAPASLSAKYYPGVQAPGVSGGFTYEKSYIAITATPDNGNNYVAKIYYTQAEGNAIPDPAMNSIKKHNSNPYVLIGTAGSSTTDATGRYITTNTLNDFSLITLTNQSVVLAVKLIDITATNIGRANRINWSTADELSSDQFQLEESFDGIHFTLLATIHANGQPSTYTYWDNNAAKGTTYYRIKMISVTGNPVYSKVVSAVVHSTDLFVVTAYPNPVMDRLTLQLAGTISTKGIVRITDIAGRLVQVINVPGNTMDIDMKHLPNAVYIISYRDDRQSASVKVIKE